MAWKHGRHDPYRLFNGLDDGFVPFAGGKSRRPRFPWRYRAFLYACAQQAQKEQVDMAMAAAGGQVSRRL